MTSFIYVLQLKKNRHCADFPYLTAVLSIKEYCHESCQKSLVVFLRTLFRDEKNSCTSRCRARGKKSNGDTIVPAEEAHRYQEIKKWQAREGEISDSKGRGFVRAGLLRQPAAYGRYLPSAPSGTSARFRIPRAKCLTSIPLYNKSGIFLWSSFCFWCQCDSNTLGRSLTNRKEKR